MGTLWTAQAMLVSQVQNPFFRQGINLLHTVEGMSFCTSNNGSCNGSQMTNSCKHDFYPNKLVVTYYNAHSLLPKIDHLRALVTTDMPDIVCIVETWLDSSISNIEIALPGYIIVRLDRNRHGGGILMYIHSSLHFSIIITSVPLSLEFLLLSVVHKNCNAKKRYIFLLLYFIGLLVPQTLLLILYFLYWNHLTILCSHTLYLLGTLTLIILMTIIHFTTNS